VDVRPLRTLSIVQYFTLHPSIHFLQKSINQSINQSITKSLPSVYVYIFILSPKLLKILSLSLKLASPGFLLCCGEGGKSLATLGNLIAVLMGWDGMR